ncbi:flagellar protein FlaG [Oceanisphaera psychrotolerans]|uniref:Flagellar biosynthesis protein FlaG n=1 Tax=Oceanisphaera psychrotolerans TaxID=1414654 RepID=A0A1J4QBE3_9GAMM|nr:flagellar protein FlaG [Oceanisphaera psychrotolerans]OIN07721.1 flagellar biosynthesis protein FlaG [Oceanisphaera psychrotolerans]
MDTSPLIPRAQPLPAEAGGRPREPAMPRQAEATQTAQAVQATDQGKALALAPEQLEQMAGEIQNFIGSINRNLQFRVDEDSGRNVVTVLDGDTGDVVRQIPTEELLDVIARLNEASGGLLDIQA